MNNIRGTLISLKDFLFNKYTEIKIEYNGDKLPIFKFKEGRRLIVPDYQREIRWNRETLFVLINDIFDGPKFLGNIILAHNGEKDYEIIDGQQRIVMLIMVINYIKNEYAEPISDIEELVSIKLNCFEKSESFILNRYSLSGLSNQVKKDTIESDKYNQIDTMIDLYASIKTAGILNTVANARKFVDNFLQCQFNVVVSSENDRKSCTKYYLDVNLKGIKLDTEDIFKGYLFAQDTSDEIREKWVALKAAWFNFNGICNKDRKKTLYPLMRIINHYLYCEILSKAEYKDIMINDEFLLINDCTINGTKYYNGDHVVKVINNNTLLLNAITEIAEFINFISNIMSIDGASDEIKKLFRGLYEKEIKVLINFIKKIIKDKKLQVPKSLVLKYYFSVLKCNRTKDELKQMYAIYMYNGLFVLFGDTKKADKIISILREKDYYLKIVNEIKEYLFTGNIADSNLKAVMTARSNLENEDLKYKCKTLATIYNYFEIKDDKVSLNCPVDEIYEFLNNQNKYSVEHLIVNHSNEVKYKLKNGNYENYQIPDLIKQYSSYIFNFIFIPKELNSDVLSDYSLNYKLNILKDQIIDCQFSQMIIEQLSSMAIEDFDEKFVQIGDKEKYELDSYWLVSFKPFYVSYINAVVKKLIEKLASVVGD